MSLEVYIGGKKPNSIPSRLIVNNEPAEFLWGVQYSRMVNTDAPPENQSIVKRIELVYEGTESKALIIVSPNSLEELMPNGSVNGVPDTRFILFGSNFEQDSLQEAIRLYKSFFSKMNQKRLDGTITEDEYMRAYKTINSLWNHLYVDINKAADSVTKGRMIMQYAKLLSLDPDISNIREGSNKPIS